MTLREYIRQQKRTLQAVAEKYIPDYDLDGIEVVTEF
jgi:hypothetical protein